MPDGRLKGPAEVASPSCARGTGRKCITATGIIVNISKQNAETSHGINIAVDDCKTQGIEREKFRQITITATTDGGDRGPEDAA